MGQKWAKRPQNELQLIDFKGKIVAGRTGFNANSLGAVGTLRASLPLLFKQRCLVQTLLGAEFVEPLAGSRSYR